MPHKIELDHPGYPKGFPLNLDGILVKNGGSVTVDKETEQRFENKNGKTLAMIYGHSDVVKLSGTSALHGDEKKGGE